jgi:hypothetical protein
MHSLVRAVLLSLGLPVLVVLTSVAPAAAQEGSASPHAVGPLSLSTPFVSGNGASGATFDIITTPAILINGFDVNVTQGINPVNTIAVYWRPGTSDGFQDAMAGWTLLGTDDVTPAGTDNPTHVDVGGLMLAAGSTYGFYIDVQTYDPMVVSNTILHYGDGGPTDFFNADMIIRTFYGKGNPAFTGTSFFPREWSGTVHYEIVGVVPAVPPMGLVLLFALLIAAVLVARRPGIATA